ncbi:MAG: Hsp70 family protein [Thiobacillus sp.]
MAIIGIDLGTSNSAAAVLRGGRPVIIPSAEGVSLVLRLRKKGLPRFGEQGKGDLYLQVKLWVPEKLGGEERELYERLRALTGKTTRHFWN